MQTLVSVLGITAFTTNKKSVITQAIKKWLHYLHNSIREWILDWLMQVGPICLITLVAAPGIGASGAVIVLRFFRGAAIVFQDCMGSLRHFLCISPLLSRIALL